MKKTLLLEEGKNVKHRSEGNSKESPDNHETKNVEYGSEGNSKERLDNHEPAKDRDNIDKSKSRKTLHEKVQTEEEAISPIYNEDRDIGNTEVKLPYPNETLDSSGKEVLNAIKTQSGSNRLPSQSSVSLQGG